MLPAYSSTALQPALPRPAPPLPAANSSDVEAMAIDQFVRSHSHKQQQQQQQQKSTRVPVSKRQRTAANTWLFILATPEAQWLTMFSQIEEACIPHRYTQVGCSAQHPRQQRL